MTDYLKIKGEIELVDPTYYPSTKVKQKIKLKDNDKVFDYWNKELLKVGDVISFEYEEGQWNNNPTFTIKNILFLNFQDMSEGKKKELKEIVDKEPATQNLLLDNDRKNRVVKLLEYAKGYNPVNKDRDISEEFKLASHLIKVVEGIDVKFEFAKKESDGGTNDKSNQ